MLRVLLAIDDYSELLFLQTLLKKLGFDVDGIQNERGFEEAFLALNPEIIVASARGKKMSGIDIAEGLRKVRGLPKVLLLATGPILDRLQTMELENVDGLMETPVRPTRILGKLAELGGLDAAVLLEKYRKIKSTLSSDKESDLQILARDDEQPEIRPKIDSRQSTLSDTERKMRFQITIEKTEVPLVSHFSKKQVASITKAIRAEEDPDETAALEAERQLFVKELIKKSK